MRISRSLQTVMTCVFLFALGWLAPAEGAQLGTMQADKILFLGNSICLAPPGGEWENNWGASASALDKDYVHLLTNHIKTVTGGSLTVAPPTADYVRWYYNQPLLNWDGNVINMADYFERNFNTWDNTRIQNQLDWNADIVVVQMGENMENGSVEQFKIALADMLTGLKNSSNPHIFVTSNILGANTDLDEIKRQLCADDPTHRVFVDLNSVWTDATNHGLYGHPNDAGMAQIADKLFDAMVTHSVPEPSSVALLGAAIIGLGCYAWNKRGS